MLLGTATAVIDLEIDRFMANAARAESAMGRLGQAGGANRGLTDWASRNERAMNDTGRGFAVLGGAMIATFGAGIKAAADLEQGLANIEATLGRGATPDLMGRIADETRRIGVNSQYSAPEVSALMDALLKAGIDAEQALGPHGATQAVVDLASATGETLPVALTGVTQAMNTWSPAIVDSDIAMTDASRAADILTVAANESSAGVGDIIMGMRNIGPVAASFGVGFDEAAASVAVFTGYGLKGADAGVSLARGIQNLVDPTSDASAEMERLGIDAFDAQGNFIGFPPLFDQLSTALAGATDEQKALTLGTIFGAEAIDVMGLAALTGGDDIRAMTGEMSQSGIAAEQAAKRLDTLKGAWQRATEGVSTLLGTIMAEAVPGLTLFADLIARITESMIGIPRPLRIVAAAVLGIGGAALLAAGAFLIMLPRILETRAALATLQTAPGILGKFSRGLGRFGRFAAIGARAFGVIGLAATALYFAYKTNFLGIGDIADDFVAKFVPRFKALNQVTDPLSAVLFGVGAGLRNIGLNDLGGWFEGLARGTDRVIDSITAFGRLLDLSNPRWAAAAGPLKSLVSGFRLVSDSVSDLISAFQEGGWSALWDRLPEELGDAGRGLQRVWEGFTQLVDALDIPAVALRIGGWLVSAAVDVGGAIADWVTGTALPAAGAAAQNIGSIALTIGGWLISAAKSVWSAIKEWVLGQGPAGQSGAAGDLAALGGGTGGAGINLGTIAVLIGGWIISAAKSLWGAIQEWVAGRGMAGASGAAGDIAALGGGGGQGVNIGTVAVLIGGWIVSALQSLRSAIVDFVLGGGSGGTFGTGFARAMIGTGAITHPSVAVNIAGWIISAAKSIGSAIRDFVLGGATSGGTFGSGFSRAMGGTGDVPIPSVGVTIRDWSITAGKSIAQAINEKVMAGAPYVTDGVQWVLNLVAPRIQFGGGGGGTFGSGFGRAMGGGGGGGGLGAQINQFIKGRLANTIVDLANWTLDVGAPKILESWGNMAETIKRRIGPIVADLGSWTLNVAAPKLVESWGNMASVIQNRVSQFFAGTKVEAVFNLIARIGNVDFSAGSALSTINNRIDQYFAGSQVKATIDLLAEIGDVVLPALGAIKDAIQQQIALGDAAPEVPMKVIFDMTIGKVNTPSMEDIIAAAKAAISIMGPITVPVPISLDFQFGGGGDGGASPLGYKGDFIPEDAGSGMFAGLATQVQTELASVNTTIQTEVALWGTTLSTGVTTMVAQVGLAMFNLQTGITTTFGNIGLAVSTAMPTLSTAVTTAFTIMVAQVGLAMFNLQTGVALAFTTIATSATVAMATLNTAVGTGFTTMVTRAASALANLQTGVATVFASLSATIGTAMNSIATRVAIGMSGVVVAISGGMNRAAQAATNAAQRISNIIGALAGKIANDGQRAGDAFANGIESGFSSAVSAAQAAASSIVGAFSQLPGTMAAIGRAAGAGLAGGLRSQIGAVSSAASALMAAANVGAAVTALISSPSKVWTDFGVQMAAGLSGGLRAGQPRVTGTAVAVVTNAISAAKQAAGISSPAKRMVPVGINMDEGLARGIRDGMPLVVNAAVSVAQAAVNAARRVMSATSVTDMVRARIRSGAPTIINGWQRLADGFWKSVNTGVVRKGILAEDNTYVNPDFYSRLGRTAGSAFASGVTSGARSGLGIHSPSRVFEELGRQSSLGYMSGFETTFSRSALAVTPNQPRYDVPTRSGGGGSQTTIYQTVITPTPSEYDRIDHDARR
ncbi:MAG: phage tail tape measure protein, partial [Thermomicrobiales bacterium]|nr:phage tail tape measure protein [Thermomicrobiales bacterium]